MTEFHEPLEELTPRTRDLHRALASLKEEIEAVDWYNQRAERAADPDLRRVIEHNRNEEIEHACMTLEWLRRAMPEWDAALRTYVFVSGDIVRAEAEAEGKVGRDADAPGAGAPAPQGDEHGLGVGALRQVRP